MNREYVMGQVAHLNRQLRLENKIHSTGRVFAFLAMSVFIITCIIHNTIETQLATYIFACSIMVFGVCFIMGIFISSNERRLLLKIALKWTDFYTGSKWRTAAGERGVIKSVGYDGIEAKVIFEDGDERLYPLWLMEPLGDFERVERPHKVSDTEDFLLNVASAKFKTFAGTIGVVRGVSLSVVDGIQKKTVFFKPENGDIVEIDLNYLVPVV